MITLEISKKFNKNNLWGNIDSEIVFKQLDGFLSEISSNFKFIEVNLNGISSIDDSFIKQVFIKILEQPYFQEGKSLVFSNPSSFEILYYINETFKKNSKFAFVKINDKISTLGKESFIDKSTLLMMNELITESFEHV